MNERSRCVAAAASKRGNKSKVRYNYDNVRRVAEFNSSEYGPRIFDCKNFKFCRLPTNLFRSTAFTFRTTYSRDLNTEKRVVNVTPIHIRVEAG